MFNKMLEDITVHQYLIFTSPLEKNFVDIHKYRKFSTWLAKLKLRNYLPFHLN